jgi:hypothetical protein
MISPKVTVLLGMKEYGKPLRERQRRTLLRSFPDSGVSSPLPVVYKNLLATIWELSVKVELEKNE